MLSKPRLSTFKFDLIATCDGDSGAPYWQTTGGDEADICSKKNVLVAIEASTSESDYMYPQCITKAGVAHKITKEILKWIRTNMEKYDSETK